MGKLDWVLGSRGAWGVCAGGGLVCTVGLCGVELGGFVGQGDVHVIEEGNEVYLGVVCFGRTLHKRLEDCMQVWMNLCVAVNGLWAGVCAGLDWIGLECGVRGLWTVLSGAFLCQVMVLLIFRILDLAPAP